MGDQNLEEVLARFETALIQANIVAAESFEFGCTTEKITAALGQLGLVSPPDVLTVFQWHNGCLPLCPSGSLTPRGVDCLSLEQAVDGYQSNIIKVPEMSTPGWFPVFKNGPGYVVVYCGLDRPPIASGWDPWTGGLNEHKPVKDLATAVGWWVERLENRQWRWLPPNLGWEDDTSYQDLTEEQRGTGLV
ncbi:MAG: SMI1/KNR4 family protein [Angustibacter sp.]